MLPANPKPSRRRLLPGAVLFALGTVAAHAESGDTTLDLYGFAMLDTGYQSGQNDPDWFDVVRPTKLPSFEDEFGEDGEWFARCGDGKVLRLLDVREKQ